MHFSSFLDDQFPVFFWSKSLIKPTSLGASIFGDYNIYKIFVFYTVYEKLQLNNFSTYHFLDFTSILSNLVKNGERKKTELSDVLTCEMSNVK